MSRNIPALLQVIDFIYENIVYAEINTKSSYCKTCGASGHIEIVEDSKTHRLGYRCKYCGETNPNNMNLAVRVCGSHCCTLQKQPQETIETQGNSLRKRDNLEPSLSI